MKKRNILAVAGLAGSAVLSFAAARMNSKELEKVVAKLNEQREELRNTKSELFRKDMEIRMKEREIEWNKKQYDFDLGKEKLRRKLDIGEISYEEYWDERSRLVDEIFSDEDEDEVEEDTVNFILIG